MDEIEQLKLQNDQERRRVATHKQRAKRARASASSASKDHFVQVRDYTRPLQGAGTKVVMSTDLIASRNDETGATSPNKRRRCSGGPRQMRNISVGEAVLHLPGCHGGRGEKGGIQVNERWLLPKVYTYMTTVSMSINALAKVTSAEIALLADQVSVRFTPLRSNASRKKVPTGKPINVLGEISPDTLFQGICAGYLALDRTVVKLKYIQDCDILQVAVDSSSFSENSMQGVLVTMTKIEKVGCDAIGTPCFGAHQRSVSLNGIACADKVVKKVLRADGSMFVREASYNFALQLIMAGAMKALLDHPCIFAVFDKGTECKGAGKGPGMAQKRESFIGEGSYIEQIWGTREAIAAVMQGESGNFVRELMTFLGVEESDQPERFEARPMPCHLDTSGVVSSIGRKLVVITRGVSEESELSGGVPTTRTVITSRTEETLLPKTSTKKDPLSAWPLILGGCAHAGWCDKHCLNVAGVHCTKKTKESFLNMQATVSMTRHACVFTNCG